MYNCVPGIKPLMCFLSVILLSAASQAESSVNNKFDLQISGLVAIDVGQVVEATGITLYQTDARNYRPWINEPLLNILLSSSLGDNFQVFAGLGAQVWYNTIHQQYSLARSWIFQKYCNVSISQAEGVASFPNRENPIFQVGLGIFPYKYNEDVRNLGEYLFRSTAYPALVHGGFEQASSTLTGLRISLHAIENLRADVIVSMETETQPYHDFSFAAVADYDIAHILKIGAGVQFYHLISVDEELTTPDSSSGKAALNSFVDENGETGFYSHRGTKLMGRLRLDPKGFFARDGDFGIWGKEDFKIYGEINVLGLKNYPDQPDTVPGPPGFPGTPRDPYQGYDDIMQKMPIVFGVNLPTTKWGFDVLALEAEWFGISYPNDHFPVLVDGLPRMMSTKGRTRLFELDNWKWSVYAKRSIGEHFFVVLMFARDHMKLKTINSQYYEFCTPDILLRPEDWWWMTRIGFTF